MTQGSAADEFSLRNLIRQTADDLDLIDPDAVTDEVLQRIPRNLVREALQQALRSYVHHVLTGRRQDTVITDPADLLAETTGGAGSSNVGRKQRAVRDWWRRALDEAYLVADGSWLRLKDCDLPALKFLAEDRRQRATQLAAKAAEFDLLQRLVTEHGVDTVGELPEDVLQATLQHRSDEEDAA